MRGKKGGEKSVADKVSANNAAPTIQARCRDLEQKRQLRVRQNLGNSFPAAHTTKSPFQPPWETNYYSSDAPLGYIEEEFLDESDISEEMDDTFQSEVKTVVSTTRCGVVVPVMVVQHDGGRLPRKSPGGNFDKKVRCLVESLTVGDGSKDRNGRILQRVGVCAAAQAR